MKYDECRVIFGVQPFEYRTINGFSQDESGAPNRNRCQNLCEESSGRRNIQIWKSLTVSAVELV